MTTEESFLKMSAEALSRRLGSISLAEIKTQEEEMQDDQRRAFVADCAFLFERALKKDLERLIAEQLRFTALEAGEWGQVLFGRGAANGLLLLQELFETRRSEHIGNMQKEGKPEDDWFSGSAAAVPPKNPKI